MIELTEQLKKTIDDMDTVPIVITQVDPDAIGSAMLLRYIAMKLGKDVTIYYCGHFGHPQNRTMFTLFDLGSIMFPIKEMPKEIKSCALVDSSMVNDSRLMGRVIDPIIIIDHHDTDLKTREEYDENGFILIERIGAATTLLAELLFSMGYTLPKNSKEATLGSLAVFTDTKMLINATERDVLAYSKLLELADKEVFRQLQSYPLPQRYFEHFKEAVNNWKMKEGRLVTGIGFVSSKDADQLAIIADSLIRMPEIQVAVTWGIVDNSIVRISARCTDPSMSFHDFLTERFGKNSGVKTSSVGVAEGGAFIKLPSGFWAGDELKGELISLVKRKMDHLILEELSINERANVRDNDMGEANSFDI
ncbi:DHH family phosphoesterase [Candidatus Magnetominusculus xianensis]|uniref:Potassium transporter TrkA n=1 Tax=Candidatus Magnetominusculus xianensis TaxID=1748249 RepID=A0ABR5SHQ4_9BACT|nr:DHH family phosphoesterase [Candidatus Magnetominusculus xianensis]KWT82962.1 potassium transporter TrkA [Candidatus Magnetominusculus xianensis]MBF0403041.1 DHH family phosphoesterase [Nitrospirota bacterium]